MSHKMVIIDSLWPLCGEGGGGGGGGGGMTRSSLLIFIFAAGRGRGGGAPASKKGTIQNFQGSRMTFDD